MVDSKCEKCGEEIDTFFKATKTGELCATCADPKPPNPPAPSGEATPAPWKQHEGYPNEIWEARSAGRRIAECSDRHLLPASANARLIVDAVNNAALYETTLKANQDMTRQMEALKVELALFKQAVERCNKEHDPLRSTSEALKAELAEAKSREMDLLNDRTSLRSTLNAMRGAMSKIYGLYSKSPDEAAFKIADAALKGEVRP